MRLFSLLMLFLIAIPAQGVSLSEAEFQSQLQSSERLASHTNEKNLEANEELLNETPCDEPVSAEEAEYRMNHGIVFLNLVFEIEYICLKENEEPEDCADLARDLNLWYRDLNVCGKSFFGLIFSYIKVLIYEKRLIKLFRAINKQGALGEYVARCQSYCDEFEKAFFSYQ